MVMPTQQQVGVSLNMAEVYAHLCPECQKEMQQLIKDKVSDQMVNSIIGIPAAEKGEKGA